jgi:hypothetical protein
MKKFEFGLKIYESSLNRVVKASTIEVKVPVRLGRG